MSKSQQKRRPELHPLNAVVSRVVRLAKPPIKRTVSEWADTNRALSPENSAEAGKWKTKRTPYLREPMDAFSDPVIKRITVVASSQVGKTEMMLNMLGAAIDDDPGPMMYIMPTLDNAQDFSKRRVAAMIRDTKCLTAKVSDAKSRDGSNTILKKQFPGGMLTMTGSNSPSSLASTPIRYVFGDERDRWALTAGSEGDPWGLAEARTTTFYNAKLVDVSTPTIKGFSAIESAYNLGTRERWCHECPECHEYNEIEFDHIVFKHRSKLDSGHKVYVVDEVEWACPACGCLIGQSKMRRQPAKWIASNPEALETGHRSFWLTAFASPWMSWNEIVLKFLQSRDDPEKLKVVYNTIFGKLWEDRGELEDEDTIISRREVYDAELPEGVLVLTCGVDTQDNRLEYEVVGHGLFGETWGIKRGAILGKPDDPLVWQRLDDVLNHVYVFGSGKGLRISLTCVDSGGHYTQEVYSSCRSRQDNRVFAIRGVGGDSVPFTSPPKQAKITIDGRYLGACWYYNLGVDAGKAKIMGALKVQEPGPRYCHFPSNDGCGYDEAFFAGLLSEKLTLRRRGGVDKWVWEKLPGHRRNEPLDCRNYALAAIEILNPDMEAERQRLLKPKQAVQPQKKPKRRKKRERLDEW